MILVLVEKDLHGAAVEVSLETLTFARSLSEAGGGVPVDAVVVGEVTDDLQARLAAYGVREVHTLAGRRLRGVRRSSVGLGDRDRARGDAAPSW